MTKLSDKPKLLYIVRDRLQGNKALRDLDDKVMAFSEKRTAKIARDTANDVSMKDLTDVQKSVARSKKQRFYVSPGPDHHKFSGGKV